jgi:hypothetical protein
MLAKLAKLYTGTRRLDSALCSEVPLLHALAKGKERPIWLVTSATKIHPVDGLLD